MKFSAIVLAAGTSSRMAGRHKMLLPVGGETAIRRTVRRVLASGAQQVVVVTGFNADAVTRAVMDLPVALCPNPRFEEGQMTSVAAGVGALTAPCDAVMVCLGDQVLLNPGDYRELVDAYRAMPRGSILVPCFRGTRGNPIVFSASYVPQVIGGQRKLGCRKLVTDYPEEVFVYQVGHDRFTTDMDTPEDYALVLERAALEAPETEVAGEVR